MVSDAGRDSAPFYDPARSYEDNFEHGPFGLFSESQPDLKQAAEPAYRFLGHPVHLPFGIPAGPLLNGRFVKAALDGGFDVPVYKTVRTHRYASHAWPNVLPVQVDGELRAGRTLVAAKDYGDPLSITNSFGVPSFDPEVWQPDLADAVAHTGPGQLVVGSFQGTLPEHGGVRDYIADFALGARLLRETGVKAVEVNLSCPNEGTANLLCFDPARSRAVVEAIKAELGAIPLVVKIAYFDPADNDARLRTFVREVGAMVDAVSAINTVSAEIVNERGAQALPGEGRLRSGVCGSAIQWAGLEMTARLKALREAMGLRFEIVGVGGVMDAAGYRRFRAAGADAVMSATGAMWNTRLALQIKAAESATHGS